MRYLKLLAFLITSTLLMNSCVEPVDERITVDFANNVVSEMMRDEIIPSVHFFEWAYITNEWLLAADDEVTQSKLEYVFFQDIPPILHNDGTIEIYLNYPGYRMFINTNHHTMDQPQAEWLISFSNTFHNVYKVTFSDDNVWDIAKLDPEETATYTLQITSRALGDYWVMGSGKMEKEMANSPVVGETFLITEPLYVQGRCHYDGSTYYHDATRLVEGKMDVQLHSESGIIEGDDINVTFSPDNSYNSWGSKKSEPEMGYYYSTTAEITFRGITMQYSANYWY